MSDVDAPRYAIVELMGHRRLGARVREVTFCGAQMLQLRVLARPEFEQLVSPTSLYALTWCDEAAARKVHAASWSPRPHPPELAAPPDDDESDDDDEGDENPIGNPCCDCGAQPGEPCAPDCDGPAVGVDTNNPAAKPATTPRTGVDYNDCPHCGSAPNDACDRDCPVYTEDCDGNHAPGRCPLGEPTDGEG